MNQLRAWLYGHHGPVVATQTPQAVGASDTSNLKDERQSRDNGRHMENTGAAQPEQNQSSMRSALLKVIPLAPGDCLECKLVGTGVMALSGLLVLTSALTARRRIQETARPHVLSIHNWQSSTLFMWTRITHYRTVHPSGHTNPNLAGVNGMVYLLLCSGLFVGFQTAAFCRLFDTGPFNKEGRSLRKGANS